MGWRRVPRLTVIYLVVGGGLVAVATLRHFESPLLELAVAVTLPWSLGYGLFIWSAIHGLAHELALYLAVCLGLNTAIICFTESRWRRR